MIKGTTETGFEFEIEDEILDDYELIEVLVDVDGGDMSLVPKMIDMLLGTDQKNKLKEHVRNTAGKVSAKAMMEEIAAIFKAKSELKN